MHLHLYPAITHITPLPLPAPPTLATMPALFLLGYWSWTWFNQSSWWRKHFYCERKEKKMGRRGGGCRGPGGVKGWGDGLELLPGSTTKILLFTCFFCVFLSFFLCLFFFYYIQLQIVFKSSQVSHTPERDSAGGSMGKCQRHLFVSQIIHVRHLFTLRYIKVTEDLFFSRFHKQWCIETVPRCAAASRVVFLTGRDMSLQRKHSNEWNDEIFSDKINIWYIVHLYNTNVTLLNSRCFVRNGLALRETAPIHII